ncbi:MAG: ABC transporter permease [Cytophagales bacterium]|nr:ABC transporter permease [Cytophagales bacterium]
MNLKENFLEGFRSLKANLLRASLTAAIITIGIMALVGILTTVDALHYSIVDGFASMGGNSFTVHSVRNRGGETSAGKSKKVFKPISYKEFKQFKQDYQTDADVMISGTFSWMAVIKYLSEKTDPNVRVYGADENMLKVDGYNIALGRNFSNIEVSNGSNVVILGQNIREKLFKKADPVGKTVSFYGVNYRVIGVLEKKGGMFGGQGIDRAVIVPVENAMRFPNAVYSRVRAKVYVSDLSNIDFYTNKARLVMRRIRRDVLGHPDSFEIKRNKSVNEQVGEMTNVLRIAGFVIAIITLLGASVGLMNIMLVSVTERTREIGIRKALGAKPRQIRMQFLIEAITICLVGCCIGVFFGLLAGNGIGMWMDLGRFIFPVGWIFLAFVMSMLVGVGAGFIPARKASRMDPIVSLRYE